MAKTPEARGGKRMRGQIYGNRITVSLRMESELHERLMSLCDELNKPANSHINELIEADLKKRKK